MILMYHDKAATAFQSNNVDEIQVVLLHFAVYE